MNELTNTVEYPNKAILGLTYTYKPIIEYHISTANYHLAPTPATIQSKDYSSGSNEEIWWAIINETITHGMQIILNGFTLFEWFPRSPGLFHTEEGKRARNEVRYNNIIRTDKDGTIIYDPYGKASMLAGGVGSIRLRPIDLGSETYCLMSASSNGICHEGLPVALPNQLYLKYIQQIRDKGGLICNLVGKLKFIPKPIVTLYEDLSLIHI